MLLAVDIGNASIDFGLFENDTLCWTAKTTANPQRTADDYALSFLSVFARHNTTVQSVRGVVLCSVVPALTQTLMQTLQTLFSAEPYRIRPGIRTGMNLRIDLQTQIGADLVAQAVAATHMFTAPLAVVDCGTATAITVVDTDYAVAGVILCPGLRLAADALFTGAAALSPVPLQPPQQLIGKNTEDSLQAGLLIGHAAMVDGLLGKIAAQLSLQTLTAVLTGGLAPLLQPYCTTPMHHVPHLTLQGLRLLYERRNVPRRERQTRSH